MRLNNLVIILLFGITGCASLSREPAIKIETQIVEVPIVVGCKQEIPPYPNYCFKNLKDTDSIYTKTQCMLSDLTLSKGYEIELVAKLSACK